MDWSNCAMFRSVKLFIIKIYTYYFKGRTDIYEIFNFFNILNINIYIIISLYKS